MKHNVSELYKINGAKFYTADYIEANDIPKGELHTRNSGWSVARSLGTNKDNFRIYTAEGVKIAYAYGEKTWFDTKEERDIYREEQTAARANTNRKNKLLKLINEHLATMSEEELVELLEKF